MSRGIKASQLIHEHRLGLFRGDVSLKTGDYFLGISTGDGNQEHTSGNLSRTWASPMVVPRKLKIDRLAVNVTTLQAASLTRLGLYRAQADGTPGVLVVDGGTVDSSTTGVKTVTVDESLSPGLYWCAWEYNVASVGLRGRNSGSALALGFSSSLGNFSLGIVYVTHTFGALPDPFGTVTAYDSANTVRGNAVYLRVV